MKRNQKQIRGQVVKVEKTTKHVENHKIFIVTLTETLVCWVIRSWVIQVYTIHKSSQLLSVWSISARNQCVSWTCFFNTIIFYQINFVANFCLYIMIEGSSQQLLVISQFSQFFDVMAHISAERHLSKISFSYFYTPWPPLTF